MSKTALSAGTKDGGTENENKRRGKKENERQKENQLNSPFDCADGSGQPFQHLEAYITENTNLKKAETYQYEYLRDESSNSSVVKNTEGDEGFLTQLSRTFSVIAEYFR